MFKEIRRKDRQTSDKEVRDLLIEGEYGTLATLCENGYPYSTPLSYIYYNGAVYFHCAREGQKLINIDKHNKVSFSIVGKTETLPDKFSTNYESVILFGKAERVEGEEKEIALLKFLEKYCSQFIKEGKEYISKAKDITIIIKINIEHISGKARR